MPEIISTAQSLVQTNNGKRFYVFSGEIAVDTSETPIIDIDNIGERDIKFHFEVGALTTSSSNFTMLVKSNGVTIFNTRVDPEAASPVGTQNAYKFILPANTSLEITLESSSATVTWTVAGYGKYLSM